ncbi:hypothetical protein OC834_001402 [Tilletia horrida]|uniref:Uncharacterized protein n=1 Tax=Tilletia horrida TaxID=155126 RepID=A0AAN6G9W5_9BASI|nr:hypothetical protein OC842_005549 [Tilletia horrida]KAK0535808.1 hypothetical protein OC834_001402 [Tilletia horrida]KAK0539202.1 hypothetical protein OC835_001219 [Tilletia horrida]
MSLLGRTSFLETVLRAPLQDIAHLAGRHNFMTFTSMVCSTDGVVHDIVGSAYWPGLLPQAQSWASLVAAVAYDDQQDEITFGTSADECEVMPGDPEDGEYAQMFMMNTPWRLYGRGEVIKAEPSFFILKGLVYIGNTNRSFTVKVLIDRDSGRWAKFTVPRVGDVCGFRGAVNAVETQPFKHFVVKMESYSAPDPSTGGAKIGPSSPSKDSVRDAFAKAYARKTKNEGSCSKRAADSAAGEAGPSTPSTSTSATALFDPAVGHEEKTDEDVPVPPPAEPEVNDVQAGKGKKRARNDKK